MYFISFYKLFYHYTFTLPKFGNIRLRKVLTTAYEHLLNLVWVLSSKWWQTLFKLITVIIVVDEKKTSEF